MSPDDLVDQRQSQTRPLIKTRLKRLKDLFQLYTGKADAGVRQYDANSLAHFFRLGGECPPSGMAFRELSQMFQKTWRSLSASAIMATPRRGNLRSI